ncbi:hypothetical protein BASA81_004789 [Batrachochytrium salamandrivorans]|nr:hypothetical protein BASA81_004789 [Batrachochytrium salamandrivorans]
MSPVVVVSKSNGVAHVELARSAKGNAMNLDFWNEYREMFHGLAQDSEVRCIVVSGQGKFFTVGLDVSDIGRILDFSGTEDPARRAFMAKKLIATMQETFTAMERCPQPVIACVHNACIGGGIDLMTAADIRMCTQDAFFSIKEVDIALAADVGTLQRIERCVGSASLVRDWAYTARRFDAEEARASGLVSRVFPDKQAMLAGALEMAAQIASKSPVAVAGTKHNLNYARGRTLQDSLEYMATWNASMLQTDDIAKAATASFQKQKQPLFPKL